MQSLKHKQYKENPKQNTMSTENRKYRTFFELLIFMVKKKRWTHCPQIKASTLLFSLLSMFDGMLLKTFRYLENLRLRCYPCQQDNSKPVYVRTNPPDYTFDLNVQWRFLIFTACNKREALIALSILSVIFLRCNFVYLYIYILNTILE